MRVLIVFGTTEGHTREICQFAARVLREAGRTATVEEVRDEGEGVQVAAYDAVLVAGSLHLGRYQPGLVRFVRRHLADLAGRPNAFVSVSLAAAGENPDDWAGLNECVATFEHETGWTPEQVHHAAGAIKYSQYDFFKRLVLKHIAAKRGQKTVTSHDCDLTDYEDLRRFVLAFAEQASG